MAISDIDPTTPLGSDPFRNGDDEIRQLKSDILSSFPNISGQVVVDHNVLNNAVQTLSISGNQLSISAGNTVTLPDSGGVPGDIYASQVISSAITGCSDVECALNSLEAEDASLEQRIVYLENTPVPHTHYAQNIPYDGSSSGLPADNVQDAIDEVNDRAGGQYAPIVFAYGRINKNGLMLYGSGNYTVDFDGLERYTITFTEPYPTGRIIVNALIDRNQLGATPSTADAIMLEEMVGTGTGYIKLLTGKVDSTSDSSGFFFEVKCYPVT